jgi:GTPase SAR1 family protein
LKILIIGNSGVGKSCMLMRYVENSFTTAFYNTIGVDFVQKYLILENEKYIS